MVETPISLNIMARNAPILRWIQATDLDTIGSVFVYRATSKYGGYSLIGSVGSVDVVGSTVVEYTDSNGKDSYWYAISFYDGTNTSTKSNRVSPEMIDFLSDVEDVKRITGIVNELTDAEIQEFINMADQNIFQSFGEPVIKGNTYTNITSGEYTYDMTGNRTPIYRLDRFEINGSVIDSSAGSFTVDLGNAFVTVDPALIELNAGNRMEFEFIPQNYNLLSQYMSAMDIFLTTDVLRSAESTTPKLDLIKERINALQSAAAVPGVVMSTGQISGGRLGETITQDFDNLY